MSQGQGLIGDTSTGIANLGASQSTTPDTILNYGAIGDGVTDNAAAFRNALAQSSHVIIPPGNYLINSTVSLGSNQALEIQAGARIIAGVGLTNLAMFDTPVGTLVINPSIYGAGIIDCNDVAGYGFWPRYYIRVAISGIRISSALIAALKLGDTAAAGRSAEAQVSNISLYRPSTSSVPASSYGLLEENSGDAQIFNAISQGYQTGFASCAGAASAYSQCHAWSDPASGLMTQAFLDPGGCCYINCLADSPSVYGWNITSFNTVLIGGRVYCNSTVTDNTVIGIHYSQASPVSTIHGMQFIGTGGHRLAKDTDLTVPTSTFTSVGCKSTNVAAGFLTTDRVNFVQASSWFQPTGGAHIYSGTGAPTISASSGDFWFRTDTPSTANQRLYVCTGTTNWTAIL